LDGVEEKVGATIVDGLAGEVSRDHVESFLDSFAGVERREGEGIVGDDRDGWLVGDAVVEAGVLVVASVGAAADAV
jgi:hypothetical protein